jgi:hypothetical protein
MLLAPPRRVQFIYSRCFVFFLANADVSDSDHNGRLKIAIDKLMLCSNWSTALGSTAFHKHQERARARAAIKNLLRVRRESASIA